MQLYTFKRFIFCPYEGKRVWLNIYSPFATRFAVSARFWKFILYFVWSNLFIPKYLIRNQNDNSTSQSKICYTHSCFLHSHPWDFRNLTRWLMSSLKAVLAPQCARFFLSVKQQNNFSRLKWFLLEIRDTVEDLHSFYLLNMSSIYICCFFCLCRTKTFYKHTAYTISMEECI